MRTRYWLAVLVLLPTAFVRSQPTVGTSARIDQHVPSQTAPVQTGIDITNENMAVMRHVEELRASCIKNRRIICGKIIKVLPDGIVVDSGYTNLMRPPLNRSWLIPATVDVQRTNNFVERSEPDSICFGQVFLTDLPKAPPNTKLNLFDFVVLEGFPMGEYTYVSSANVQHTVRRFSTKVANAVRWMYGREVDPQEN
jgi:hypothetical protein